MDFEWDSTKEQGNRKKHGIDFRTAAKVFLDPYVIEFVMSMPLASCASMRSVSSTGECSSSPIQ